MIKGSKTLTILTNKITETTENPVLDTSVTYLIIEGHMTDLTKAQKLDLFLKNNQTITYINLPNNQIGAEGAKAIADALKVNHTITNIDFLYNNQIGAEGASIVNALEGNMLRVKKLADFLVEKFIIKKDFTLQSTYSSAFKYYQVADKKLLQEYVEQSISNKSDNQPIQTTSFTQLCNNVESFNNSHYFHLAAICKTYNSETDSINSMPQSLCEYVASFLGSHSLLGEATE